MTQEQEKNSEAGLVTLLKAFGDIVSRESQLSGSKRNQLIDTIVEAAANESFAGIPNVREFETKRWSVAVIASSVLLFFVVLLNWRPVPDKDIGIVPLPVQSFAGKHRDQMQIALEHEAIMGCPLAWYVEQGRDVQFALLPDHAAGHPTRVVFAELTIEKLHNEPETCFIMVRDTQPLELFSKDGSTLQLLLWLYPVEDNLFAYELAMNGQNGMERTANTSGLIEPETTVNIEDDHAEYRVFLCVHPA